MTDPKSPVGTPDYNRGFEDGKQKVTALVKSGAISLSDKNQAEARGKALLNAETGGKSEAYREGFAAGLRAVGQMLLSGLLVPDALPQQPSFIHKKIVGPVEVWHVSVGFGAGILGYLIYRLNKNNF